MMHTRILLIVLVLLLPVAPQASAERVSQRILSGPVNSSAPNHPEQVLSLFFIEHKPAAVSVDWNLLSADVTMDGMKVFRFAGYYRGQRIEGIDAVILQINENEWNVTVSELQGNAFAGNPCDQQKSASFLTLLPDLFRSSEDLMTEPLWVYESSSNSYRSRIKVAQNPTLNLHPQSGYLNPETAEFSSVSGHVCFADSAGFAHTRYHGNCTLPTWYQNGNFSLKSTLRGQRIETVNLNHQTGYSQITPFEDSDNHWEPPYPTGADYATDAHYCAVKYYDFLSSAFNRNSIDNNGYPLVSYLNYGQGLVNAFWNGNAVVYGSGNSTTLPYTTLDIAGHEFTHGLIQKTSNLNYSGEPGTLNESIADILGAALEFYAAPQQSNWTMAESSGTILRSMAYPKQFNQPDTYHGTFWYYGSGDNGGVHINSGFLNKWFYLLAAGGQGINDNGFTYSIQGIGIEKATAIVYETLLSRLIPASDFSAFRSGSLLSAHHMYGSCSIESAACLKAWEAVGFGMNPSAAIQLSTPSGTSFCEGDSLLLLTESFPGASYDWYLNAQLHAITSVPFLQITTEGNWHVVRRFCNEASVSAQVFLNRLSLPLVTTSSETICSGTSAMPVSFPAGGSYSIPFPWSGPSVSYSYTYSTAAGCEATATGVITVVPLPVAEITTNIHTIALNSSPLMLEGTSNGIFSGPGVTNGWFYPEAAGTGGPYEITYTVENAAGCVAHSTIEITVTPPCQLLPVAPVLEMTGELIFGEAVTLTLNGIDPALVVSWKLPPSCTYTVSGSGHSIALIAAQPTVDVAVTIRNDCGDEVIISKQLTVVKQEVTFAVFPNPAKESTNIVVNGNGMNQFTYRIYNVSGVQVLNGELSSKMNRIPLTEMRAGWYVVEITDGAHQYRFPLEKIN